MKTRFFLSGIALLSFGLIAASGATVQARKANASHIVVASQSTTRPVLNQEVGDVDQQTFDAIDGPPGANVNPETSVNMDGTRDLDAHVAQNDEGNVNDGARNQVGGQGQHQNGNNNGRNGQTGNNSQNGIDNGENGSNGGDRHQ